LVLAALLYVFGILPSFATLAVAGGGVLLVLLLYLTQKAKTTIKLSYKGNLDDEAASRFSEMREALEDLASSEGIWHLPGSVKLPKAGEVAPTPEREPARVGLLPTPGIKADVPVWGIEAAMRASFSSPRAPSSTQTIATSPSLTTRLRWPSPRGAFSRKRTSPMTRRS